MPMGERREGVRLGQQPSSAESAYLCVLSCCSAVRSPSVTVGW